MGNVDVQIPKHHYNQCILFLFFVLSSQVLANFVSNAAKFSTVGDMITVMVQLVRWPERPNEEADIDFDDNEEDGLQEHMEALEQTTQSAQSTTSYCPIG